MNTMLPVTTHMSTLITQIIEDRANEAGYEHMENLFEEFKDTIIDGLNTLDSATLAFLLMILRNMNRVGFSLSDLDGAIAFQLATRREEAV